MTNEMNQNQNLVIVMFLLVIVVDLPFADPGHQLKMVILTLEARLVTLQAQKILATKAEKKELVIMTGKNFHCRRTEKNLVNIIL